MFRRIARRLPRFGLPTLCATMLLAISLGGAARYGLGPEHEEAAALRALEDESIGYWALRPSGTDADSASLSAVAWNPFTRLGNWIGGVPDRIGGIEAQAWPSEATRETLFDLPHVRYLSFAPPTDLSPIEGPGAVPTPEEILGRPLPAFPPAVALAPEPPPAPRGIPLSDAERDEAVAEMTEAWKSPPTYRAAFYLCRDESTDFPGTTRLTVSRTPSAWLLRYRLRGTKASATTELWSPEVAVNQTWHEGAWHTYSAGRGSDGVPSVGVPWVGPEWPADHTAGSRSWWLQGEADETYQSVERLTDGTLAFRLKPRELSWSPNRSFELLEGLFVVDPTDDFAIRRFEMVNDLGHVSGARTSYCYIFEHERIAGHVVPVQTSSWTDFPANTIDGVRFPAGPRTAVARYAWEFDPDVPASLFEPPTGKGVFFTSTPSTEFHWWYVTGGLSLGWIYFAATNGIRRRFRRKKAEGTSPRQTRNAIAETIGAS